MNTGTERRADSLNFIQTMLLQLGKMAKGDRFDVLAYLIDMAYIECSDMIKRDHDQDNRISVDHKQRNSAA